MTKLYMTLPDAIASTPPNYCETCDHKRRNQDGGHCYMFKAEPAGLCGQHTNALFRVIEAEKAKEESK